MKTLEIKTAEQLRRTRTALAETNRFIEKESAYSEDLQNMELLAWYRNHALYLESAIAAFKAVA